VPGPQEVVSLDVVQDVFLASGVEQDGTQQRPFRRDPLAVHRPSRHDLGLGARPCQRTPSTILFKSDARAGQITTAGTGALTRRGYRPG
jgi:hypothetical protein